MKWCVYQETRWRQLSFAICCGMPNGLIAQSLNMTERSVATIISRLVKNSGMDSRLKFALHQNACVRELLRGQE